MGWMVGKVDVVWILVGGLENWWFGKWGFGGRDRG